MKVDISQISLTSSSTTARKGKTFKKKLDNDLHSYYEYVTTKDMFSSQKVQENFLREKGTESFKEVELTGKILGRKTTQRCIYWMSSKIKLFKQSKRKDGLGFAWCIKMMDQDFIKIKLIFTKKRRILNSRLDYIQPTSPITRNEYPRCMHLPDDE